MPPSFVGSGEPPGAARGLLFIQNPSSPAAPFILPIQAQVSQGVRPMRPTMSTRTRLPRLGEREFVDYPVFLELEANLAERSAVLRRALLAALGVACALLAAAIFLV